MTGAICLSKTSNKLLAFFFTSALHYGCKNSNSSFLFAGSWRRNTSALMHAQWHLNPIKNIWTDNDICNNLLESITGKTLWPLISGRGFKACMTGVHQPSYGEKKVSIMFHLAKMLQNRLWAPLWSIWPKMGNVGNFLQKLVDTTKFSIRLYPSNLRKKKNPIDWAHLKYS